MKRSTLLAPLAAVVLVAPGALADDASRIAKAREAIKGLADDLRNELVTAIKAGGPVAALQVCNSRAIEIQEQRSKAMGLSIARTALKVRNPRNAADDFERKAMEGFIEKMKAGADPMTLEHAETTTKDGAKVFRYMKPIPTAAEPCLACHGSELKPEVAEEVKRLYPADQATGFKAGDLRGAFTVTQKVE
jgi:hypothetical protein